MNTKTSIIVVLFAAALLACAGKKTEHHGGSKDWPEMDKFHMIMAEAYHPFKDSANLKPAVLLADSLVIGAAKWAGSTPPEKADNDAMKASLKKLSDEAQRFAVLAKGNTPEAELGKELTSLHTSFHSIMESFHGEKH